MEIGGGSQGSGKEGGEGNEDLKAKKSFMKHTLRDIGMSQVDMYLTPIDVTDCKTFFSEELTELAASPSLLQMRDSSDASPEERRRFIAKATRHLPRPFVQPGRTCAPFPIYSTRILG